MIPFESFEANCRYIKINWDSFLSSMHLIYGPGSSWLKWLPFFIFVKVMHINLFDFAFFPTLHLPIRIFGLIWTLTTWLHPPTPLIPPPPQIMINWSLENLQHSFLGKNMAITHYLTPLNPLSVHRFIRQNLLWAQRALLMQPKAAALCRS